MSPAPRQDGRTVGQRVEPCRKGNDQKKGNMKNRQGVALENPGARSNHHRPGLRSEPRPRAWCWVAALAVLLALWAQTAPAKQVAGNEFTPAGVRDINFLHQNLYYGNEFSPVLTLDPPTPITS